MIDSRSAVSTGQPMVRASWTACAVPAEGCGSPAWPTMSPAACAAGASSSLNKMTGRLLSISKNGRLAAGADPQASSHAAAGTTTARVLQLVAAARAEGIETPIVLMGYCNPFLRYGLKRLYEDARVAGADGLIVPDLPAHLADDWIADLRRSIGG